MTSVEKESCREQQVARVLADPTHHVWPPVGAEREVDAHGVAALAKLALPALAYAVEELKLILTGGPAVFVSELDYSGCERVVMRGEGGIEACLLCSVAEHLAC
jgi:hypothetical protein